MRCTSTAAPPAAFALIERLFTERMAVAALRLDRLDYKTVLQELTARLHDTAPVYVLSDTGPDHDKRFSATVIVAGRVGRRGRGPLEEDGRAGRRRAGVARALRLALRSRHVPELPEVETVRRGLEAQVVGRRITQVEVGPRAHRAAHVAPGGDRRAHRRHDPARQPPRQVPAVPARHRRRADGAPAHERPAAGGRRRRRAAAAHARGDAPGRRARAGAVVRRPAHVRRGGGVRPGQRRRRAARTGEDGHRPDRRRARREPSSRRSCAAGRARSRRCCSTSTSSPASATSTATRACTWPACAGTGRRDAVTPREITRLHAAIMTVLGEAIEAGGSTLADTQYVGIEGESGWFQLHHRVYDRAGQRCLTCGQGRHRARCALPAAAPTSAPAASGRAHTASGKRRGWPSLDNVADAVFLKALTLKGFKSFADATTLQLEPGVTVVVGPNGSGKSNVVDAIAWVLGAQAPSAVRSQKMDDVIFAGTAKRPALGRAEVTLTLDNSAGLLPIEFTEVTVSRTLFRTGESEYAINGVNCRLLDVQELLSDAGVGRQQHVIVSQGQIDAVLNARPEDRRGIVEEAAGVLKYRRRKEKAERRLDATEASLLRVQDLLREVRRQLRPLERQADAARRHGALVAELDGAADLPRRPRDRLAARAADRAGGREGHAHGRRAGAAHRAGCARHRRDGRRGRADRPRRHRPQRRDGARRAAPRARPRHRRRAGRASPFDGTRPRPADGQRRGRQPGGRRAAPARRAGRRRSRSCRGRPRGRGAGRRGGRSSPTSAARRWRRSRASPTARRRPAPRPKFAASCARCAATSSAPTSSCAASAPASTRCVSAPSASTPSASGCAWSASRRRRPRPRWSPMSKPPRRAASPPTRRTTRHVAGRQEAAEEASRWKARAEALHLALEGARARAGAEASGRRRRCAGHAARPHRDRCRLGAGGRGGTRRGAAGRRRGQPRSGPQRAAVAAGQQCARRGARARCPPRWRAAGRSSGGDAGSPARTQPPRRRARAARCRARRRGARQPLGRSARSGNRQPAGRGRHRRRRPLRPHRLAHRCRRRRCHGRGAGRGAGAFGIGRRPNWPSATPRSPPPRPSCRPPASTRTN